MFDFKESSASKIKEYIKSIDIKDYPSVIDEMKDDSRKAIVNLCISMDKKYKKYQVEIERINNIKKIENKLYDEGAKYIAGLDEVGRGPLSGPVVTAAVIMPKDSKILYINDSKKLNKKKREELAEIIKKEAISYSVGIKDNTVIDNKNILNATKEAMLEAINNLNVKPDVLVIDAVKLNTDIKQESLVKGDERVYSIAAASIIAKVYRDNLMAEYAKDYPDYGFESNKGYGTFEHTMAIKEKGLCKIHRRSFTSNFLVDGKYEYKDKSYKLLKSFGYSFKEYDYNFEEANIDFVTVKDDILVFVVVGNSFSEKDIKNIIKCGKQYIRTHNDIEKLCRFDQVLIEDDNLKIKKNVFLD